jgi:hypothetical protein
MPADQARSALPHRRRSRRAWVLSILGVIVLAVLELQAFANFYTDYLWYRSENITYVWRAMTET